MDLASALQAHSEWKVKLRTAIAKQESMDIATISADNCCPLGKWLHGEGKTKFGNLTTYGECMSTHAAFHKEAGRVALKINLKQFAQADAMLEANTAFSSASGAVGAAILRLKKESGL